MPSGRTHKTATVLILAPTALAAGLLAARYGDSTGLQDGMLAASMAGAGVLATLAVHPDLDLVETYIHLKVRANPLSFFWYAPWWPYGKAIAHRHWASHFPLIGTAIRLAYMIIPIVFLFGCLLTQRPDFGTIYQSDIPGHLILWFVFGMAVSDSLHYTMDKVVTGVKRAT